MFASVELARRIELAEARFTELAGRVAQGRQPTAVVTAIGSGVGVATGEDSPFDKVIGLGFGEDLDLETLTRFEDAVRARGGRMQVELASLAHPGVGEALTERGYALVGHENVLAKRLDPAALDRSGEPVPDAHVRVSTADELDAWIDVLVAGFSQSDTDGAPSHEEFPRHALERVFRDLDSVTGVRRFVALRDGVLAGAASLRIDDGLAYLSGAATLPAHRRRGVQTALLDERLAEAARAGCELAVVTTLPGSKSQENTMRRGFSLLYVRAILVRKVSGEPAGSSRVNGGDRLDS